MKPDQSPRPRRKISPRQTLAIGATLAAGMFAAGEATGQGDTPNRSAEVPTALLAKPFKQVEAEIGTAKLDPSKLSLYRVRQGEVASDVASDIRGLPKGQVPTDDPLIKIAEAQTKGDAQHTEIASGTELIVPTVDMAGDPTDLLQDARAAQHFQEGK